MIRLTGLILLALTLPARPQGGEPAPAARAPGDKPSAAARVQGDTPAVATPPQGTNTVITSDYLEFDYKRQIAVFDGHVVVVDPQVRMKSDRMTVLFSEKKEVKQATASGHVEIENEDMRATCLRAIYSQIRGQIVLIGDAVLIRDLDSVKGDKITYWIDDQRMECEPGTLVITPSKEGRNKGKDLLKIGPKSK